MTEPGRRPRCSKLPGPHARALDMEPAVGADDGGRATDTVRVQLDRRNDDIPRPCQRLSDTVAPHPENAYRHAQEQRQDGQEVEQTAFHADCDAAASMAHSGQRTDGRFVYVRGGTFGGADMPRYLTC